MLGKGRLVFSEGSQLARANSQLSAQEGQFCWNHAEHLSLTVHIVSYPDPPSRKDLVKRVALLVIQVCIK